MLPTYCLPAADVRTELLRPSGTPVGHPLLVNHDVVAGDAVVPAAAQLFCDPPPPLEALDGHWTFTWDAGPSWFEEALEVHVHARDPSKRVDVVPSERHVRVELDGEIVAESRRPHALFETTLPTRWYLPPEDVRRELLVPSDTSRCPYKGTATYWSCAPVPVCTPTSPGAIRSPCRSARASLGWSPSFNEEVDLVVDGVGQERPSSPWS